MPWKVTAPVKERTKFLLEWERRWGEAQGGPVNLAELCRMFGVSRPTGYAWVKRYLEANLEIAAAIKRSRRPKTSPTAISDEMADLIVEARKMHPRWGPRKLRAWIVYTGTRRLIRCGRRGPEGPIAPHSAVALCGAPAITGSR